MDQTAKQRSAFAELTSYGGELMSSKDLEGLYEDFLACVKSEVLRTHKSPAFDLETYNIVDQENLLSCLIAKYWGDMIHSGKCDSSDSFRKGDNIFTQTVSKYLERTSKFLQNSGQAYLNFELVLPVKPASSQFEITRLMKGVRIELNQNQKMPGNDPYKGDHIVAYRTWIMPDEERTNHQESRTSLQTIVDSHKDNPNFDDVIANIFCVLRINPEETRHGFFDTLERPTDPLGRSKTITIVTSEPMPTRLSSLVLGTEKIKCIYHVSLHFLKEAVQKVNEKTGGDLNVQLEVLQTLEKMNNLRDIQELPFDLLST